MHGLNKLRSEFKLYIRSPLLYRQYKGGNFFRFAFYNDFYPITFSCLASFSVIYWARREAILCNLEIGQLGLHFQLQSFLQL